MVRSFLALLLLFGTLFVSCTSQDPLVPRSLSKDKDIPELLRIARRPGVKDDVRFAALEPLISRYRESGENQVLNTLLSGFLEENPQDPYGAYYLMAMAQGARDEGSEELALDYFRRLLKNYPDLDVAGRSLHLLALGEIARKTPYKREAIDSRKESQRRFSNQIDTGANYYALAKEYGAIGSWDSMFLTYQDFLDSPETVIAGEPDARSHIESILKFHTSTKDWTFETLDDLVGTIKYAIRNVNPALLIRYQADDFFMMNWSQQSSDSFTHIPVDINNKLTDRVRYSRDLADFSTDREAYLWTAGWSWKIPSWYLYFRQIDYPADPEMNGRWEWTGIYFGERL
ncbi:MAG: hypothetical protein MI717_07810 [Spirochaetales bacterium]|nr:hypothetical protein [Spirochaetales bacterium]